MSNFASRTRKILCIARNYVDHAKELGNKTPSQPFYFLKPPSAILEPGQGPILRPQGVKLHYELELAVILNKELKNLDFDSFTEEQAIDAIEGYTLALDLTARNVQDEAKKKGMPWTIAKGFDTFLPVGPFIPKSEVPDPHNVFLQLKINGQTRQADSTSLMIFRIPQILANISAVMTLQDGDMVLTGTPKGVGEIVPGDVLEAELQVDGKVISSMKFTVDEKPGPYTYRET